jgi:glycosyltransferase involved in cell wall biosynthesis
MKVAIILTSARHSGPVKVIQVLAHYLREFPDIQLKVFLLKNVAQNSMKIDVPLMLMDRGKFTFEDYDIIHTSGIRPDLFAFLNRGKIKYHISTIHNYVFTDLRYSHNRFIAMISGLIWMITWTRTDKLICVSRTLADYYRKWFDKVKLTAIHNGISEHHKPGNADSDIIAAVEGFRSKGLKVLGSVANLTGIKGIDQVLHLMKEEKGYAYVIVGDGKRRSKLEKLTRRLSVSERCLYTGFRSNAISCFHLFDIFIIPSRSEGFCLTLIEAAQQGVPVVCSDIEVFRELMSEDEVTFFKSGDCNAMAEAIKIAMQTSDNKVRKAFERYRKDYTGRLMSERYRDLYWSVAKNC